MRDFKLAFEIAFALKNQKAILEANEKLTRLNKTIEKLHNIREIAFNVNIIGWELIHIGSRIFSSLKRSTLSFVDAASRMEIYRVQFETLYKSAQKARQVLNEITLFAQKTPFELEELIEGWKMLKSYGLEPNVRLMRAIGDATASLGGGRDTLEGIIRAIGQIYAKGKLSAEELMQLAERGIPVYEILQEKLALTREQIANIGNAGIDARTAIEVLIQGMQERFGGGMERLSATMQGSLSNLRDFLFQLKADIGIRVMQAIRKDIQAILRWLEQLKKTGKYKRIVEGLSRGFYEFYRILRSVALALWGVIRPFVEFLSQHPRFTGFLIALVGGLSVLTVALGGVIIALGIVAGGIVNLLNLYNLWKLKSLEVATAQRTLALSSMLPTFRLPKARLYKGPTTLIGLRFKGESVFSRLISPLRSVGRLLGPLTRRFAFFGRLLAGLRGVRTLLLVRNILFAILGLLSGISWPLVALIVLLGVFVTAWMKNWGGIREKTMKVIRAVFGFLINAFFFVIGFFRRYGKVLLRVLLWPVRQLWRGWLWFSKGIFELLRRVVGWVRDFISRAFGGAIEFIARSIEYLSKMLGKEDWVKNAQRLREIAKGKGWEEPRWLKNTKKWFREISEEGRRAFSQVQEQAAGISTRMAEMKGRFSRGISIPSASVGETIRPQFTNYYITQHFESDSIRITTQSLSVEEFRELMGKTLRMEVLNAG